MTENVQLSRELERSRKLRGELLMLEWKIEKDLFDPGYLMRELLKEDSEREVH